jgi:hypothetical protein
MAALWEKLKFWKKSKMYKEGVDYRFVDVNNSEITAIELLLDNYENVVYHYHKARIKEEGEVARLQFGYTLLNSGNYDIDELNTDQQFHVIMGDILTQLLISKEKDDEQIRNNNSSKFDLQ